MFYAYDNVVIRPKSLIYKDRKFNIINYIDIRSGIDSSDSAQGPS